MPADPRILAAALLVAYAAADALIRYVVMCVAGDE
jgi:hypothetical protein